MVREDSCWAKGPASSTPGGPFSPSSRGIEALGPKHLVARTGSANWGINLEAKDGGAQTVYLD